MLLKSATTGLVALVPFALAECYTGGAPFPDDHTQVIVAIQSAGTQFEVDSPLTPGEHPFEYTVGDKVLHFILDNISGEDRSIDKNEAIDGFTKEYSGCHNGGDTSYTNWRYV